MSSNAAYRKRWRYERDHGIERTVPDDGVRMHIASLVGAGMSIRSVAAEADTSPSVVSRIHQGKALRVNRLIAGRITSVQAKVARKASAGTSEPFVPKVGAVRRIQALLALGWTHAHQTEAAGVRTALVMHQQGRWITLSTHDKIAATYADLSQRQGPSARTRGRALKLGYLTPIAWDDIDLDGTPDNADDDQDIDELDEVAVQRALNGDRNVRLTTDERREVVRRWQALDRPLAEMERVTGINAHRYLDRESA